MREWNNCSKSKFIHSKLNHSNSFIQSFKIQSFKIQSLALVDNVSFSNSANQYSIIEKFCHSLI